MSVSLALVFPPVPEVSPAAYGSLSARIPQQPVLESVPNREAGNVPDQIPEANSVEDAVKLQIEPPGEIAVYQFLNRYGNVILQIPPQQWLNLAQQISQDLARESATKSASPAVKGEGNGH